ncbi:MAG: DUF1345 domain-containing protein [Sulfuriferula sp.]
MRNLSDFQRLTIAIVAGLLIFFALPDRILLDTRIIASWDAAASTSLLLAWVTMAGADAVATQNSTLNKRQSSSGILALVTLTALASLMALTFLFKANDNVSGLAKITHVGLSVIALATSWLLIHTRYAFHYAHRYYVSGGRHSKALGGLTFPGGNPPDYFDFAYFSFVIGMTSQVSDVAITSRVMRRITLIHGLLSFAFNMGVLALSINIVASMI